jgi:hypothetical protein
MSDYDSTNLVSSDEEGWTLELDEGLVENYDQGAEAVENDNFDFDDLDDEGIDAPYDLDLMDDVSEEEDPAFNEMIEKNRLELEQRKQAALKIQALQRGKKGRNAANHAKERKLLQEQGAAVVKIQARLRGRNERETQRKLKEDNDRIQQWVESENAATKIQALYRGRSNRKNSPVHKKQTKIPHARLNREEKKLLKPRAEPESKGKSKLSPSLQRKVKRTPPKKRPQHTPQHRKKSVVIHIDAPELAGGRSKLMAMTRPRRSNLEGKGSRTAAKPQSHYIQFGKFPEPEPIEEISVGDIPVEEVADEASVAELMELEKSLEFLRIKIANEKGASRKKRGLLKKMNDELKDNRATMDAWSAAVSEIKEKQANLRNMKHRIKVEQSVAYKEKQNGRLVHELSQARAERQRALTALEMACSILKHKKRDGRMFYVFLNELNVMSEKIDQLTSTIEPFVPVVFNNQHQYQQQMGKIQGAAAPKQIVSPTTSVQNGRNRGYQGKKKKMPLGRKASANWRGQPRVGYRTGRG